MTPRKHFFALCEMIPGLRGLAILDSNGGARSDSDEGGLNIVYWKRYEVENYFVTPEVLRKQVAEHYKDLPLFFGEIRDASEELLDALILERVFDGRKQDLDTWKSAGADAARLLWEARTERVKLSDFAEEFFRRLAERLGEAMLLRKGELHRLIRFVDPSSVPAEVGEKLDLLGEIFDHGNPGEEQPVSS